jgi:hypothetical protein
MRFLSDHCTLHDAVDQGYAALSAALFLPLLHGRGKDVVLPRPLFHDAGMSEPAMSNSRLRPSRSWERLTNQVDKLLTLSCNARGLRALLSSVFYEPGTACNVATPLLQSIFAVIDSVNDDRILANMLMSRLPHIAFLWPGAMIMGVHKDVLRDGRFGLLLIELHAAMWTGTLQSFIQEPVSRNPTADTIVLRSDECRLLYLTRSEHHTRWPVCPWAPFGSTTLEDTDIDVRLHAQCRGHGLRYAGWKWACRNGQVVHQTCDPALQPVFQQAQAVPHVLVNYEALRTNEEFISENATRSIFGWLRFEGYPTREKDIHQHEWIMIDDSDEEVLDYAAGESPIPRSPTAAVESWLDNC